MISLKSCPRCQTGDMYRVEEDSRHCLQCGHIQYAVRSSGRFADLLQSLSADIPWAAEPVRGSDKTRPVAI